MIAVQLINDLAVLNNFNVIDAKDYVPGDQLSIKFQISDEENDFRLIPSTAATLNCTFQLSDGTFLVLPASFLFNPDDRSCWKVDLTGAQTMLIVGGNFKVVLDFLGDGTDIRSGMAYNVLSKITFDGEC